MANDAAKGLAGCGGGMMGCGCLLTLAPLLIVIVVVAVLTLGALVGAY